MITENERREAKAYIEAVFENAINREGKYELLDFMEKIGYFRAPASTKYHLSEEGGLMIHSIHVAMRMLEMKDATEYSHESIMIVSLLHDLCKADQYRKSNISGEYVWNNGCLPLGHGEKSLYWITQYMKLTDEEALAIRWHMGGFDYAVKGGSRDLDAAFNMSKLAVMLSLADMQASQIDER